jgi:5-(carboxyamino)imidazole ribonucleotide mutase
MEEGMATHGAPLVGIVMGSDSDWPSVRKAADILKEFAVAFEVRVISAHRAPAAVARYAAEAEERGLRVIVAAAGGAAHLGGVLAAHTIVPVVGIPVAGGALNGLDALLATVQMPAGVPVAAVTLGSAGPVNAALFAIQILGAADPALRARLRDYRESLRRKVEEADARIAAELRAGL